MPYRNQEADFATLMEPHSEKVKEIIAALRKWLAKEFPILQEEVKLGWGNLTYSAKGAVCAITPELNHVMFHFYRGAELDDPEAVLHETGQQVRSLKIKKAEKLPADKLAHFLEMALMLDGGKQPTPA